MMRYCAWSNGSWTWRSNGCKGNGEEGVPRRTSGTEFSWGGVQECSHVGLNLLVMRAKPQQVALGSRDKPFGLRNMVERKERVSRLDRAVILARDEQRWSCNTAQVSAAMVDVMEKTSS